MGLSSAGIGSGLDINGIVSSLMNAERAPLNILRAKEGTFTAKLSAFGAIKSAMDTFKNSLANLTTNSLNLQSATSSMPDALAVTASATAKAGTYAVTVQQLAQSDKQVFPGVASATDPLGAGTLSITVGSGAKIAIDTTDSSLQGVSQAINKAKLGVTATIINDGTTNRLVITGEKTGAANTVKVEGDLAFAQFNTSNPDGTPNTAVVRQVPQDAKLTIDGIAVTKPSNLITDAIAGVTLTLNKLSATPIAMTVKRDDSAVKANVANFVKAINVVNSNIRTATSYNANTRVAGILNGDSSANSILTNLRKEISTPVSGLSTYSTLASMGIAFQRDGSIAIDDAKLSKAMTENPNVLTDIFTGENGIAARMDKLATNVLSENGVIATRTVGLNSSIKSLNKQEAALNDRLAIRETNLRKQFGALDSTLAGLQAQSNYVSQQLAAMYRNNNNG